jgi:hypothetical protein
MKSKATNTVDFRDFPEYTDLMMVHSLFNA